MDYGRPKSERERGGRRAVWRPTHGMCALITVLQVRSTTVNKAVRRRRSVAAAQPSWARMGYIRPSEARAPNIRW